MKYSLTFLLFCLISGRVLFAQESGRGSTEVKVAGGNYTKVHGLFVGISNYLEVNSLDYAHNDAELMKQLIGNAFDGNIGKIVSLTNEKASEFSIMSAISTIRKNANSGDLVVIYLAGHGDVAEGIDGNPEGYFLAHNASKSREYEIGGTVPFNFIVKFVTGLTSKNVKVWLITDACRSGKIIDAKGASSTLTAIINGYENTTKFISCQSNELSYEYDSLAHGVFTYYFAKAFAGEADTEEVDGIVTVDELNRYLTSKVRNVTSKKQTPNIHAADKFAELMVTNPEYLKFLVKVDKIAETSEAGKKRGDDDLIKSKQVVAFEDAVLEGKFYGSKSSAYEIYMDAKRTKTLSNDELEFMEDHLLNALLQRVQHTTNAFLSGKPQVSRTENYALAIEDIKMVEKLMPQDHPLFDKIKVRGQFFEAMEIVKTEQFEKYKSTEKILLDLEKKEPNAAYIHEGLALLYIAMNDKDKAEQQLAKAKAKINTWSKPVNTEVHLNIVAGKLEQAEKILENSSLSCKDPRETTLLKARIYNASSAVQLAEKELADMAKNAEFKSSIDYLLLQAELNNIRGRIRVAEDYYLQALKLDKENIDLIMQLADIYRMDGDTTNALKYYNLALEVRPGHAPATRNINQLKNVKAPIKAADINIYSRSQVVQAVEQLLAENNPNEAMQVLNKAMQTNNWDPEYFFLKGKIMNNLGKTQDAEMAWKAACQLSPNHIESISALAYLYLKNNKRHEIDALFEQHNKYFLQSSRWNLLKYDIYKRFYSPSEQSALIQEAKRIDALDVRIYEALYKSDLMSSNYRGAYEHYQTIEKIGGRMQDSTQFVNALKKAFETEIERQNGNQAIEALRYLRKFDKYYMVRVLWDAQKFYQDMNYKASMSKLNQFKRYMFILEVPDQIEYYRLQGYVLLELGQYLEAIENFKLVNRHSRKTAFLGIAMAQFELKQSESIWRENFRKDPEKFRMNASAEKRYDVMNRNMGMQGGGSRR